MRLRLFSTLFLVAFCGVLFAQPQQGLHFMRHTYQASQTNPALLPAENLVITLPNFYSHLETTGPAFGDLIRTDGGQSFFNVSQALPALEDENTLRNHTTLETIGVSFGLGPVRLGIGHATHFSAYTKYTDELARLIWEGNGNYIGQTLDISNDVQVSGYHEIALAASYKIKKVTIGARGKFLSGIGDVSTDRNAASVYTDPEIYDLTLTSDYRVNTSAFLDFGGVNNFNTDFNFGNFGTKNLFSSNNGFAFDLGVSADLGKIKLAASLVDFGQINWSENTENHTSSGTSIYGGLDFSDAITGGGSFQPESALDTLEAIFNVTTTSNEYSTELPQKMYLSAAYQLNDVWLLGASFYNETYREETATGISIGAQAGLWKFLTLGANYSVYNDNVANIGLNATAKYGPVQILVASDNVLGVFDLDKAKYTNLRMGANLIF